MPGDGKETASEIGKGRVRGIDIDQEMTRIMNEIGIEKGIGKLESEREETETETGKEIDTETEIVEGVGVVQGVGVGTAVKEIMKMVTIAKSVAEVLVPGGGLRRMPVIKKNQRRRRKRKRRLMAQITLILKLLKPTDSAHLSV